MPRHHDVSAPSPDKPEYTPAMHREMVAVAAYYRAERRGFAPGDPTADWLEAEAEIEYRSRQAPQPAIAPRSARNKRFSKNWRPSSSNGKPGSNSCGPKRERRKPKLAPNSNPA